MHRYLFDSGIPTTAALSRTKVGGFLLNSPTPWSSSSVPSAAGDSPLSPSKGVQQVSWLFFLSALHTPEDAVCKSLQVERGPRGLYPSDRSDVQPLCSAASQAVVGNCWSMWPGGHPPACFQLCLYQSDLNAAEGAGGHAGNSLCPLQKEPSAADKLWDYSHRHCAPGGLVMDWNTDLSH